MKVVFPCPSCERPGRVTLDAASSWQCPGCDHIVQVAVPPAKETPEGLTLESCAVCGNHELFKKKDFPHLLGISILAVAVIGFLILHASYQITWAWVFLIGSALIDGALYLLVRDAVVCYNCEAEHRGIKRSGNAPFELTTHERYRQQKIRGQQMKS